MKNKIMNTKLKKYKVRLQPNHKIPTMNFKMSDWSRRNRISKEISQKTNSKVKLRPKPKFLRCRGKG